MDDVTYVSSRSVRKRKAADDVDARSSKRVQPKDEFSSDQQRGRDDVGGSTEYCGTNQGDAAMSSIRFGTNPQLKSEGHADPPRQEWEKVTKWSTIVPFVEDYIKELERAITHLQGQNVIGYAGTLTSQHSPWQKKSARGHVQKLEQVIKSHAHTDHPALQAVHACIGLRRDYDWSIEILELLTLKLQKLQSTNQLSHTGGDHHQEELQNMKAEIERLKAEARQKIALKEQLQEEQGKNQAMRKEMQDLQNNLSNTARQRNPSSSDLQRQQALQNAIKERDQARVNNEKLKRQLQDLQRTQRDAHNTDGSQQSRVVLQAEKAAIEDALKATEETLKTYKSENKQLRTTRRDLKAQLKQQAAEITQLKTSIPNLGSKKDKAATKEALKAAKARTKAMYEHYDSAQAKGAILYAKLRRVAQALDADTPSTSFRKNLDALEIVKLTQLNEYEDEEEG